ncbi:hypothetical protein EVAR_5217_1 [Eumeta japonica]|uniref:Sushi domain-containing protein n=1 Tax=Eumeta variegata TaxID=151549 RepID=A0A4C1V4P6_EUMVA|nr:hypothetical protein EVAR_5217_1 [Eumeta japonica]
MCLVGMKRFCCLIREPGVEYSCGEVGVNAGVESCGAHAPEGSVVIPRCSSPYYESRSPLKSVKTCENGKWKNIPEHSKCFVDFEMQVQPPTRFLVVAGKFYKSKHQPNEKKQQSEYTGPSTSNQHDIALVFLSTPFVYDFQNVWPICLNFDKDLEEMQLSEGRSGIIPHWSSDHVLHFMELPNVDIQRYVAEGVEHERIYQRIMEISSDRIGASHSIIKKSICVEDNGGRFAVAEPDPSDPRKRRYYLRGVVSLYDFLLCFSNFYTVFTKVSAHEDFIKANTAGVLFLWQTFCNGIYA